MNILHGRIGIRFSIILLLCCSIGSNAFAHIKNEASQFPDIEFSKSRFDIVVLVGVGIIPETPVFEPDRLLTKKELATWAALAKNVGPGGETPNEAALAASAVEHGLIDSLEGNATLNDINAAVFAGALSIDEGDKVPTKAEAASLIADQLHLAAGLALLSGKGLHVGGTGVVSAVEPGDSHHGVATYTLTIGRTKLPMDSHGRVANGPVDLLQWSGRAVARSFVRGEGHHAEWTYLETEQPEEVVPETPVPMEPASVVKAAPPPPDDRTLLYGLVTAVVIIGLLLFFRRRRQS